MKCLVITLTDEILVIIATIWYETITLGIR